MKCPACTQTLKPKAVFGVRLDECPDCCGLWFDDGELMKLLPVLKASRSAPDLDLDVIHKKPAPRHENAQRHCPRCGTIMLNYNYCYNSNVLLDRCADCRGIWMDAGELMEVIRYAKGNPKLDRLAAAMAEHVAASEYRRTAGDELLACANTSLQQPGPAAIPHLLVALFDVVRRWHRD